MDLTLARNDYTQVGNLLKYACTVVNSFCAQGGSNVSKNDETSSRTDDRQRSEGNAR